MTVVTETTVLKCQLCPSLVCSCIWTVEWLLVLHWPGIAAKDVPTQETSAQWAKSGVFVQRVYWVYLFSQNTCPLCNAAMYEQ